MTMTMTMESDDTLTLEARAHSIIARAWRTIAKREGWPDSLAAPTCGELCAFLLGNSELVAGAIAEHDRRLKDCIAAVGARKWRELAKRFDATRTAFLVDADPEPDATFEDWETDWLTYLFIVHPESVRKAAKAAGADVRRPLNPLLRAWCSRAVAANLRPNRIFPAAVVMHDAREGDARGRLFSPAMHAVRNATGNQLIMPGFERDVVAPALPLALYDLGINRDSPGPGAPLALRFTVEGCLAVPQWRRRLNEPVSVQLTLRELLDRLWPNRRPKPNEYLPQIEGARAALASPEAGIPWPGGVRWAVMMTNTPAGLDDMVRLVVDLPPGSENGPQVSANLHTYGPRKGRHYRALLNLAYWWHEPGRTLRPVRGGKHWVRVHDPARYRKPTDAELVNLVFPTSARGAARKLVHEAHTVIAELGDDGELRIVDGKILPPLPTGADSDTDTGAAEARTDSGGSPDG